MTYTWTPEQLAQLTFGSTVIARGFTYVVNYIWGDWVYIDGVGYLINEFDPSTLRPPSIEWIRELAKERLGPNARVVGVPRDRVDVHVLIKCDQFTVRAFDTAALDRYRAAVAAIVALANAGLGRKGG